MALLQTQNQDINVLAGQTLDEQFDCYVDDAFSSPFDLSNYTLQAVLTIPSLGEDNPVTLTDGNGLTVDAPNGIVALKAETTGWKVGRGRWYLQAVDTANETSYPFRGVLFVGNP